MTYYVYSLVDPETNLPFYIGKGSGNRPYDHLRETKENTSNIRKFHKISKIRRSGGEPVIQIIKNDLSESEALSLEKELICKYGRKGFEVGGILMNLILDGNPPSNKGKRHSATTKLKMSQAAKGRIRSASHRANISKSKSGSNHPLWGVPVPLERRKKIQQSNLGKKRSSETRQRLSESHSKEYVLTSPTGQQFKINSAKLKILCEKFGFNKTAFVNASRKNGKYKGWHIQA